MSNSGTPSKQQQPDQSRTCPLRALNTNQDDRMGQYLNRRLDESNLSSDSEDTSAVELDTRQIRIPIFDDSQAEPLLPSSASSSSAHRDNVLSFQNFPNDWNEENENQEEPLPFDLEKMSMSELKRLATELFDQVCTKANAYPEQIATNTAFDLSNILQEFQRNFTGLINLVDTDDVDDEASDAIDEQLTEIEKKKNDLLLRVISLQKKKDRCAQMISRFRSAATLTTPEQVMAEGQAEEEEDEEEESEPSA